MTAMTVSPRARALHDEAFVLDGLTPYYTLDEPYTSSLLEGGVNGDRKSTRLNSSHT